MERPLQILVALAICASSQAQDQPDPIAALQAKFEKQLTEAWGKLDDAEAKEAERYEALLVKLSEGFTKKGDLEGVIGVRSETARFTRGRSLTEADLSDISALRIAQEGVLKALGRIERGRQEAELGALQSYGRDLVPYIKSLTKAGEIDAAVRVRKRVEALKGRIGELRVGAAPQLNVFLPVEKKFDLSDLEALEKDWLLKAAFKPAENGIKAPRGPANVLESRFEMRGDFEVNVKFHFGQAQYTNTGGTWIKVCGQRLNITNHWGGFDADITVRRVGAKLIFDNRGKVSEVPIADDQLAEPTKFHLWWRSRSCHFKALSVTAASNLRE